MDPIATTTTMPGTSQRPRIAACLQPPGQRLKLEAVAPGDAARVELERYVRAAFQARHGAVVRSFMPTLLAFRDRSGVLRGVAGVRGAHEERLYLEQYLDRPVEQALAVALASQGIGRVARHEIAEVGNLAGASCRAAVRMVAHVPAWLMSQRYAWIVFTATSALRQILAGFGAPLVELARADGGSVAAASDEWGRYYETDPRVYAGRLRDAERLAGFVHLGDH
ncbi:MAG TPA: thermostable hemolysin [Steroidobacteraceae bacterium]|nr:thermostable hemolysin [Steroidobacteraceae bacterium]